MALMLAGSKNWPKHKLLHNFGRISCGLSEARVKLLLEQVADGVSQAASEMRDHMKEVGSFANVGARMLNSWDRGVLRSLLDEKRSWISLTAK